MYVKTLVPLSRLLSKSKRSGVVSINFVVYSFDRNMGCFNKFSTNAIFVETPRILNSLKARSIRAIALLGVGAHAVTFTSKES